MAEILEYKSYRGSNIAYGNLAKLIATNLGFETKLNTDTNNNWWRALSHGDNSGQNFKWVLRQEVKKALEKLALVVKK